MREQAEQRALNNVKRFGYHIVQIPAEGEWPQVTYSIGLHATTGQPDAMVIGLKDKLAEMVIDSYCRQCQDGKSYEPGEFYDNFLGGFQVAFVKVFRQHYKNYLKWGIWFNQGEDFPMLQMVYPTTTGVWPWDEEGPEGFAHHEPLLG